MPVVLSINMTRNVLFYVAETFQVSHFAILLVNDNHFTSFVLCVQDTRVYTVRLILMSAHHIPATITETA